MINSGLYIVRIQNINPMPVTRDTRYVAVCATVDSSNIKVGKAKDFDTRRENYYKDFDQENVLFEPLVATTDFQKAEAIALIALKGFRKLSPKGGKLEWLEGISYEDTKRRVLSALENSDVSFRHID